MSPWLMPIQDNLQFLMGNDKMTLDMYIGEGKIEVEAMTYIRGRSIANAFMIIDEAQNLTMHEIKTIITRVGDNTKIVLTGDIEQIDNVYVEVPKVNLKEVVASNNEVHEEIEKFWKYEEKMWAQSSTGLSPGYEETDSEFVNFKRDAQKEVNYLVKEFECRKAASSYARASTSRTGVLSTEKLHSYRYNEDLFKKITVLPDGKNHGLVFVLDWSGSMQYVLQDTLKQLYNLIWFCRKVQIPFEVYAFTQEWNRKIKDYETNEYLPSKIQMPYEKKEGFFLIDDNFNLMNLFTSKVNAKTLEQHMINIWRIATSFKQRTNHTYPPRLVLSGTPLNETMISLHQILPQFQKENGVEKVQCIVLTDGEAHQTPYHKEVERHWEPEMPN